MRLATRQPKLEPLPILTQGKLDARLKLIQSGRLITSQGACDVLIPDPAKEPRAKHGQPGKDLTISFGIEREYGPDPAGGSAQ